MKPSQQDIAAVSIANRIFRINILMKDSRTLEPPTTSRGESPQPNKFQSNEPGAIWSELHGTVNNS